MKGLDPSVNVLVGKGMAKSPGTCGELAQGMIDGQHFLITCPIDIYSTAMVELLEGSGVVHGPEDSPKSRHAVNLTLNHLNATGLDAHLKLASFLPRGKGMASSTADVSAAIQATALAIGAEISPNEIAEIALRVEPSDGIMFPGIVQFDHREGKILNRLGNAPAMRVLVLDFGGTVDTLEFNGTNKNDALHNLEREHIESISLISEGVATGNVSFIGEGATISALAHQSILPKSQLGAVIELSTEVGAAGVNVAHSGTVIGIIFPDDEALVDSCMVLAKKRLTGLQRMFKTLTVGGGVIPLTHTNLEDLD